MATGSNKICCVCGQDVSQTKRTKDAHGNYFCNPCWAKKVATAQTASPIPTTSQQKESPLVPERSESVKAPWNAFLKHRKKLIAIAVVTAALTITLICLFTASKSTDNQHRDQLLAIISEADGLSKAGKLDEAKAKYDELFRLLGDKDASQWGVGASEPAIDRVEDPELRGNLVSAENSWNHLKKQILDREQAKADAVEQAKIATANAPLHNAEAALEKFDGPMHQKYGDDLAGKMTPDEQQQRDLLVAALQAAEADREKSTASASSDPPIASGTSPVASTGSPAVPDTSTLLGKGLIRGYPFWSFLAFAVLAGMAYGAKPTRRLYQREFASGRVMSYVDVPTGEPSAADRNASPWPYLIVCFGIWAALFFFW